MTVLYRIAVALTGLFWLAALLGALALMTGAP